MTQDERSTHTTLRWIKSSRSNGSGGNCVEFAYAQDIAHVRDSKLGEGSPVFQLTPGDWASLIKQASR